MPNTWTSKTIHFLTQAEMRALLKAIGDHKRDRALFLLAYRHGLRASEIGLLNVSDIDLKQERIRLHRLKGSLEGVHHLQPDEVKFIKAMLKERRENGADSPTLFISRNGSPISRWQLNNLMKKYGKLAKVPEHKHHFHTLKHSIATHLLDAGGELRFVQDWVGHSSIKNTIIYAQLTNRRRDEEARKVFLSSQVV